MRLTVFGYSALDFGGWLQVESGYEAFNDECVHVLGADGRRITLVGAAFNRKSCNLGKWLIEPV